MQETGIFLDKIPHRILLQQRRDSEIVRKPPRHLLLRPSLVGEVTDPPFRKMSSLALVDNGLADPAMPNNGSIDGCTEKTGGGQCIPGNRHSTLAAPFSLAREWLECSEPPLSF